MAYRDELDAALHRRDVLRRELEDIERAIAHRRGEVVRRSWLPIVRDVVIGVLAFVMLGTSVLSVVGGALFLFAAERERSAWIEPPSAA